MKKIVISGFTDSVNLIEKLERDIAMLNNAIVNQDSTKINDAFINFYILAYHIKDWLKDEGFSSVEDYINVNLELSICADLCNITKHRKLNKPSRSNDPLYHIYKDGIRADSTAYTWDSTVPLNATTYYIGLSSGKSFEILFFVKRVLELWKSFINNK